MFQLTHPYVTTGKIIALTRQIFLSKVISLLFNVLYAFVIVFFLRSNALLNSWLQSLYTVILEPRKIRSVTISTLPHSVFQEVMS